MHTKDKTQYRKIRPISPGAYLFRKPFWGGLSEGGGAYLRRGLMRRYRKPSVPRECGAL